MLVLVLLGLGSLSAATLVVTLRGGRGPGDPPASRPHVDPNGFPVLSRPRGVLGSAQWRVRASRPAPARIAAAVHTARESRTARRMSSAAGGRPSPS